jgi:hypothetical protein
VNKKLILFLMIAWFSISAPITFTVAVSQILGNHAEVTYNKSHARAHELYESTQNFLKDAFVFSEAVNFSEIYERFTVDDGYEARAQAADSLGGTVALTVVLCIAGIVSAVFVTRRLGEEESVGSIDEEEQHEKV